MTLATLTPDEREVVRRSIAAMFRFLDDDFQTRIGVTPDAAQTLLRDWPDINDLNDESDACLTINNAMNDLLHGVGISNEKAVELTGASLAEIRRIYMKWVEGRGWPSMGLR